MRVLLAAHADGFPGIDVEQPRLLHHPAAAFDDGDLALDLLIHRQLQEPERIQVLHLGLGAELFRALQAHAHVGVAAQMSLLHIASGDLNVLQHLLDLGQVCMRFVGAADVGLADDLNQRRAAAVEIHVGIAVGVLEAVVNALARVVLHVDPRDADALLFALDLNFHPAVLGQRLVILRDLIALGQIRIEIVLARKDGTRIHAAVQGQPAWMASSTAWRLSTGRAPGRPRHTGQTLVFGGAPKLVGQPQNIFVRVAN